MALTNAGTTPPPQLPRRARLHCRPPPRLHTHQHPRRRQRAQDVTEFLTIRCAVISIRSCALRFKRCTGTVLRCVAGAHREPPPSRPNKMVTIRPPPPPPARLRKQQQQQHHPQNQQQTMVRKPHLAPLRSRQNVTACRTTRPAQTTIYLGSKGLTIFAARGKISKWNVLRCVVSAIPLHNPRQLLQSLQSLPACPLQLQQRLRHCHQLLQRRKTRLCYQPWCRHCRCPCPLQNLQQQTAAAVCTATVRAEI